MICDVVLLPRELTPEHLGGRTVVVFDVLRATTSITAALAAGVAQVRVFADLDSASTAAVAFNGPKLLCGERHTLPPSGFDLGNSPGQFDRSKHAGRTVFLSTTNGTRAIFAAQSANLVLTGALVNATAVAKQVFAAGNDVTLLCAGSDGQVSFEDTLGAGAVLTALQTMTEITLSTDVSRMAEALFAGCRDKLPETLAETYGGHNIRRVHLDADIAFAARSDVLSVVGKLLKEPLRIVPAGPV